ncbi:sigma-54-dependent Fis family transcriptional regulator, partial [bacterium]|nr:sigma-54-dependent Fis family transcriptional regulator [bacterium]
REDLYYRLNVIPLEIPPLRERQEDIPVLINHFLEKFSKTSGGRKKTVHPDVIETLQVYKWPGNVRELQNLIEHLVSLIDGPVIRRSDLPDYMRSDLNAQVPIEENLTIPFMEARKQIIQSFETQYLVNLINRCNGNISKAAEEAEISRRTIYRLINTHNLHKHFTST